MVSGLDFRVDVLHRRLSSILLLKPRQVASDSFAFGPASSYDNIGLNLGGFGSYVLQAISRERFEEIRPAMLSFCWFMSIRGVERLRFLCVLRAYISELI